MVMENAVKGRIYQDLATLYYKLESHLRALESLGRTKDKFTDFLCPLVESCLPDDLLRIWERKLSQSQRAKEGDDTQSLLEKLMDFLKQEVNSEERVHLARNNFGLVEDKSTTNQKKSKHSDKSAPRVETVASLVHSNKEQQARTKKQTSGCLFCSRSHESNVCLEARKMNLDERKRIVLEKRVCYVCLKSGHSAKFCRSFNRCVICARRHAIILCPDLTSQINKRDEPHLDKNPENSVTIDLSNHSRVQVLLGTLLIRLENETSEILVRCLIDTGSQKSYICDEISRKLNLKTLREETMVHGLFGGKETTPQKHKVHRIYLSSMDKSYRCNFEVLTQHTICGRVETLNAREVGLISEECDIQFENDPCGPKEVQLLIGADVAGKLLTGENKHYGDLVAVGTKLGWMIMGKLDRKIQEDSSLITLSLFVGEESISKLWQLDLLGIDDPCKIKTEQTQQLEKLNHFMDSITVGHDGRYRVCLPWKSNHPPLQNNKEAAWKRVRLTKRRLEKQDLLKDYIKVFEEWLENEIIERATPTDSLSCFYLPHRPVIKEGSTTRIRPVFDASAHQKEAPSLNDCLEKGVNMIQEIPDLLDRFRDNKYGVVSDIEKAFLQLEVEEGERDFLRFFGVDGQEYRHRRVVFGVSSSPFLLNAVIKYHLRSRSCVYEHTVQKLESAFYVDNCVTSVSSSDELEVFIFQATELMREGCFNLRGWESNCIRESTPSATNREVAVLGLIWNLGSDTLRCNNFKMPKEVTTKRKILSSTQRVFDPIGFTCPVMLYPKVLLQELWTLKLGWDEDVPEDYRVKFEKWLDQVHLLQNIEVPRYTKRNIESQIHMFADASQKAYAACVFLRNRCEDGTVTLSLLRAKTRVSPVERVTIPRLELLACLIGTRLVKSIKHALGNPDITTIYWSDSSNALCWIRREGNWTTFVQNRVKEIKSLTTSEQWRYVPGELNPADLPSRGCSALKLHQEKWWEGPVWLKEPEVSWPRQDILHFNSCDEEKKNIVLTNVEVPEEDLSYLEYFSHYLKILRMVAWIRRFLSNARPHSNKRLGELSSIEILEAEKSLFRQIQAVSIVGHRKTSLLRIVEDDEGLLRLETRLSERADEQDFLYPIILPGDHPLIIRLIEEEHRRNCHAGPQILFGVLRERYWIIGVKKAIRKVVNNCLRCRRYFQKPIEPEPVSLPKDRVEHSSTFEVTGIDLAGPLFVKEGKIWIVLFTCAVYRAIHLEIVSSLSTIAFLQALRRFIARRGRPSVIYTDNGSNFCGAENKLSALEWNKITQEQDTVRIVWKFNPPTAAWWGGWWERLVRVIKELLRRTLGRAHMSYEEFSTVLCECESVINSRPLTYCSGDTDELIPLTPSLFLRDLRPSGVKDIDIVEASHLQKRVRYRQKLMSDLRQRFRREYLGILTKATNNGKIPYVCQVGEVVLIGDDQVKRFKWPLGVVTKLHPGKDGVVRCVSVKTATGILIRPTQRVYPLELRAVIPVVEETPEEQSERREEEVIEAIERRTRGGRLVRQPQKLDLFNHTEYILFE